MKLEDGDLLKEFPPEKISQLDEIIENTRESGRIDSGAGRGPGCP